MTDTPEPIVVETTDLGAGWLADSNEDGSFALRHPESGQRIDLSAESAALFVDLWVQAGGGESQWEYFQHQQGGRL